MSMSNQPITHNHFGRLPFELAWVYCTRSNCRSFRRKFLLDWMIGDNFIGTIVLPITIIMIIWELYLERRDNIKYQQNLR